MGPATRARKDDTMSKENKTITIRIRADHLAIIEEKAAAAGVSTSRLIKWCCERMLALPDDTPGLAQLASEANAREAAEEAAGAGQ